MKHIVSKYIDSVKYLLKIEERQNEDEPNHVYLIHNHITGLTKIGITSNPGIRAQTLQSQSGVELWLLMYIEMEVGYDEDAKSVEQFIHRHFKNKRKKGEWFDLNLKDVLEIRTLFYHIYGDDMQDNIDKFWQLYKIIKHGKEQPA